jgi:multiple sugar transport system substrate-binding protein
MVDGIKDGAAPKAVTTYMEEEARLAFEGDRAAFMRNWPYAYATGKKNKKAPKFDVAPFPTFQGGGKAGILGGHNDVISVNGKNPGGAIKVLEYLSSPEEHKTLASEFSLPPTIASVYDDPAVKKALPFAPELKQAISQAKARPVSPVYPQISAAIYKNVNEALSGSVTPEEALKTGQSQMEQALKTF